MQIHEVMTPNPTAIRADRTIGDALAALDAAPIRHLPVLEDGALIGILSDRSLKPWRSALLQAQKWGEGGVRKLLLDEPVAKHFERSVLFVGPEYDVREAIDLMLENRVGSLPVVGDAGKLIGIVTQVDLLRAMRDLLCS